MKLATNFYPSPIAEVLATEAGLLPDYDFDEREYYSEMENKLIRFQQMSLVNQFDDCLIAYFGIDLNEKQKEFLKAIYQITHQLLTGQLIDSHLKIIHEQINGIDKPDAGAITQAFHGVIDLIMKQAPKQKRRLV